MKKTLKLLSVVTSISVLIILTIGIVPVYAGNVDGLWSSPQSSEVFMIRENQGTLLFLSLFFDGERDWAAYWGPYDGTSAKLSTLLSDADLDATVTFASDNFASVTINSCTRTDKPVPCDYPDGTILTINKIF